MKKHNFIEAARSFSSKPFWGMIIIFLMLSTFQLKAQEKNLYQRLGGYDAIAAVTDGFVQRLATNEQLSKFFVGLSDNSKMKVRQLVVDQLCAATGGPCVYLGRDMKTAHQGMGITESDWDITVKLLVETLDSFKVPSKEQNELLTAVSSFKNDIVENMSAKK